MAIWKRNRGGALQEAERDADLREQLAQSNESVTFLHERLAELELAMEDTGWDRITGEREFEFSRDALRKIMRRARLNFLANPLINRAVTLQACYVWAQGVNISARHEKVNEVVQAFLDDKRNQVELTGHQARTMKEQDLQVYGNLFFAFFTNPSTGEVVVRTIPVDEVEEIITDPEDRKSPWYYKRTWVRSGINWASGAPENKAVISYYPDWRYRPAAGQKLDTIGGKPVEWDTPIYHVRVGGLSDMRFGVPEVYAALDWAKAYKQFLEDWATIVRAYSRFAWSMTVEGGQAAIARQKAKLNTTLGTAGGGGAETNPSPVTGSTFIKPPGVNMEPIRTAGATTAAEDGRRLLLMVAAATGMPESFFGDVSVGTLATAKSLDRPTELKFKDRQSLWTDVLVDILEYVVEQAAKAPSGALRTLARRSVDAVAGTDHLEFVDDPETGDAIDTHVDVTFPPILEHDIEATVKSIVMAATLDGKADAGTMRRVDLVRLLLEALGVDDLDEVLDAMFDEDGEPIVPPPPPPGAEQGQPDEDTPDKRVVEAVRDLVQRLQEVAA